MHKLNDAIIPLPLFVYGTLKQGFSNHDAFLKEAEYLGEADIKGTLLDLKYFPGYVSDGDGIVHGELYRITKGQLVSIDHLEGAGFLYDRVIVEATTPKEIRKVWTYEYRQADHNDL